MNYRYTRFIYRVSELGVMNYVDKASGDVDAEQQILDNYLYDAQLGETFYVTDSASGLIRARYVVEQGAKHLKAYPVK